MEFWNAQTGRLPQELVFDSRLTTYAARPPSGVERLILFAAILTSSVALSPAATGRLPAQAVPSTVTQVGHPDVSHGAAALQAPSGGRAGATAWPIAADGAVSPGAIPREVAARLLVQSLRNAGRRERLLGTLELSAWDRSAFLAALGTVPETVAASVAARQVQAVPADPMARAEQAAARQAAARQEAALLDTTYVALVSALSPAAAARLEAHVETRVRPRTRLYQVPDMPQHAATGGH